MEVDGKRLGADFVFGVHIALVVKVIWWCELDLIDVLVDFVRLDDCLDVGGV